MQNIYYLKYYMLTVDKNLADDYLSFYCNLVNTASIKVLKWRPIITAVKLEENLDEELRSEFQNYLYDWANDAK